MHRGDPLTRPPRAFYPGESPPGYHRYPRLRALATGAVLQGGMVTAGQLLPGLLEANLYPLIGTGLALLTGFLAGFWSHGVTLLASIRRGGFAAAGAAGLAMTAAHLLQQVPLSTVGVATMTAAVAGLLGGVMGKLRFGT